METTGTYYVFDRANTPLRKQITTLPSLADSEILVRISYAALCGSDLHTYCGLRQEPCPTILGHEIVGTIATISPTHPGKDARGVPLKVGDLITWTVFSSDPNSKEYQTETPQKTVTSINMGIGKLQRLIISTEVWRLILYFGSIPISGSFHQISHKLLQRQ